MSCELTVRDRWGRTIYLSHETAEHIAHYPERTAIHEGLLLVLADPDGMAVAARGSRRCWYYWRAGISQGPRAAHPLLVIVERRRRGGGYRVRTAFFCAPKKLARRLGLPPEVLWGDLQGVPALNEPLSHHGAT